jgi:transposase
MKVPIKFVKSLSQEEHSRLIENHQTNNNFRVRNRSHAILLSFERFPIAEIAKICRVDRDTVSSWIDNWNEFQFKGLEDEEKPGRPLVLTLAEQENAIEIGLKNPKFPHRQLNQIKVETGKEISAWTLKNLLKKRLYLETNQIRVMEKDG